MKKKALIFIVALVLLVSIPVTLYVLRQQQNTRSNAEKSTVLSFAQVSTSTTPIQKQVGDPVTLDLMVDPGANQISFVRLEIEYDESKLATPSSGAAFQPNTSVFPSVLEGPVYTPGKIALTLSVGADPTNIVQTEEKIGTLTLRAINGTTGTPSQITYGANSQVLSVASTDEESENVLSSTQVAFVSIAGSTTTPTPTPSPADEVEELTSAEEVDNEEVTELASANAAVSSTPSPTPTKPVATPTRTPTPTGAIAGVNLSPSPTRTLIAQNLTSTPSPTPTGIPATPTPTKADFAGASDAMLAPTGPDSTIMIGGFVLAAVSILGALLFFTL